jgi:hypothetical protein
MATTSLPSNWLMVLEQIQRTLAQSVEAAEAREASLVKPALTGVSFVAPDVPAKYWPGIAKKVEAMETPLLALDQTLQAEESVARTHLAEIADLRRRLADWAGRAIG